MTTMCSTNPMLYRKTVYQQVKELAEPIITAFHDDLLKHDRESLHRYDGTPFLHFTRECGTHLVMMPGASTYPKAGELVPYLFSKADRHHVLKGVVDIVDYAVHSEVTRLILHYDGKKLRTVTVKQAVDVANDYRSRVEAEWCQPLYR